MAYVIPTAAPAKTRTTWTPAEEDRLRADYRTLGAAALGDELGKSISAVRLRASRLGVTRPTARRTPWTPERDALLTRLYGLLPVEEVGCRLGASAEAVDARAYHLRLSRRANPVRLAHSYLATIRRLRILLALRAEFISHADAAAALGVPVAALHGMIVREAVAGARSCAGEDAA